MKDLTEHQRQAVEAERQRDEYLARQRYNDDRARRTARRYLPEEEF